MDIKLKKHIIHAAIRGSLEESKSVEWSTDLNISFSVSRGANAGATAEVTILETKDEVVESEVVTDKKLPKTGLFNDTADV